MSDKKVNSKMLKNLIKEVLAEQRLDEKAITFPFDDLDTKPLKVFGKNKKAAQSAYPHLGDDAKTITKVKDLAGLDGETDELELRDISTAASKNKNTHVRKTAQAIAAKGRTATVQNAATKAFAGTTPNPPNPPPVTGGATAAELTAAGVSKSSKVGDWKNAVVKAFSAGNIALAKRLHVSFGILKYTKKGKLKLPKSGPYVQATKIINGTTSPPSAAVSTAVADLYDQIELQTDSTDAEDITVTSPFDTLSAMDTTAGEDVDLPKKPAGKTKIENLIDTATAQIGSLKMDQSIANAMNLFKSNTVEGRLAELAEVNETIRQGTFASTSQIDALDLAAKAAVSIKLTNAANLHHGVAAGYAFESFIINFFGGIGAGPINGAIDAVLKNEKAGIMPTSQKLLSGGDTEQSDDAKGYGLDHVFDNYDAIVYMVGQKVRAYKNNPNKKTGSTGGKYTDLEVYVIIFRKDKSSGKYYGEVLSPDGTVEHTTPSKSSFNFSYSDLGGDPTVVFNLLDKEDDAVDAIAKDVSSKLAATSQGGFFNRIEMVYRRLENMKRNTTSYMSTAKSGQSEFGSKLTSADYIDAVVKDYGTIKSDYNKIFQPVSGTATTIAESTKKITSKMLKKLFKETLKK